MRAFFGKLASSVRLCQSFALVLLLLLFPYTSAVEAVRYRHYCGLEGSAIVTLELRDGGYFLPGAEAVLFGATPTTTVSTEDDTKPATMQARKCSCWHPRIFEGDNATQHLNSDFYCPAEVTHCGIPVTGGYQHDIHPPGCVSVGDEAKFARSIWPMLVISYAFLVTFLLCSRPGRNVLGCCFSFCFPKWNLWTTKRIIETQPSMANGIILRALRDEQEVRRRNEEAAAPVNADTQQQQQPSSPWSLWGHRLRGTTSEYVLELGPDEWALLVRDPATAAVVEAMNNRNNNNGNGEPAEPAPTALKLKTRVYHCGDYDLVAENEGPGHYDDNEDPEKGIQLSELGSSTSVSPNHEEEKIDEEEKRHLHSCTICYGPIEEGDRVGALPTCDHIFHVDCLKSWLTRRNVCPLCLSEDIAAPQYDSAENATNDSGGDATEDDTAPALEGNNIEPTERDNIAP